MATNSGYGDKKTTDWHDIVAFGKCAELCAQYVEKGSLIAIQGRITYGKYEKDGKTFKTVKILADDVTFLSSKKESQEQQSESNPAEVNPNNPDLEAEEFYSPF
jgi:single-strand DNA-binding protein